MVGAMTEMKAHCRPAAWQSVGVSDRISAKAGKQIARDVTNCRKCERRNGLMGLSLIGASCLEGGALG